MLTQACSEVTDENTGRDEYKFFAIPGSNSEHIGKRDNIIKIQERQKCDGCHRGTGKAYLKCSLKNLNHP